MKPSIAIIGAGSVGEKHARAALDAGMGVRWIIDADRDRAATLAESSGAGGGSDARQALEDDLVSGIVVCVPNRFHKELAIQALTAGKSVLLEKPMALTAAECQEINDVAAASPGILQIGFVHRYTAVGLLARSLFDQQQLGAVYHAKAHLYFRRGIPGLGKWFTTKQLSGGGALIDVGVHLVDLAMYLLGYPPVEAVAGQVYATFGPRMADYVYESMWAGPPNLAGTFDVEDSAHALIRLAGGTTLDLQVAWAGNFPAADIPVTRMGFFGDQGGISFELFGDHVNLTREADGKLVDERLEAADTDPFLGQMNAFAASIEQGKPHGPSGADGQAVQSIIDAIYRASLAPAKTS